MGKYSGALILIALVLLATSEAIRGAEQAKCDNWIILDENPNFTANATTGILNFPLKMTTGQVSAVCIKVITNNVAGMTFMATANNANVSGLAFWLNDNMPSVDSFTELDTSYYYLSDPMVLPGELTSTTLQFQPETDTDAGEFMFTVYIRIDNAAANIVNNTAFDWPADSPLTWVGQTFYMNVNPLHYQCATLNYSYTLVFKDVLGVEVNLDTVALDSNFGTSSNYFTEKIAVPTTTYTSTGSFVAPLGTYLTRLFASASLNNTASVMKNPFSLTFIAPPIAPHNCTFVNTTNPPSKSSGLSTGDIVGIVIGSVAGVILIAVASYFIYQKFRVREYEEF